MSFKHLPKKANSPKASRARLVLPAVFSTAVLSALTACVIMPSQAIASNGWKLPWPSGISTTLSRGALSNHRDGYVGTGQSVDFKLSAGTPVLAPIDSEVISSCSAGNNHRAIKLRASTGQEYSLLHVTASSDAVSAGTRYAQGEQIGVIAADTPWNNSCANSTGPHLHMGLPSVPFTIEGYTFRRGETLPGSITSSNGETTSSNGEISAEPFSGNVSSNLTISSETIDLQVAANNLSGKTVYIQMWRPAHAGYPERVWNDSKVASSNSVTFSDIDGSGSTFSDVTYYTVASLSPLNGDEAKRQRTACFTETGGTHLCDSVRR